MRSLVLVGAISAALAVAAGAFGTHALRDHLSPQSLETYRTAAHYHLIHALGIIAAGLLTRFAGSPRAAARAGWLLLAGTVLFSGSLYVYAVGGPPAAAMVTPFGGAAFIAGWLTLALSVARRERA